MADTYNLTSLDFDAQVENLITFLRTDDTFKDFNFDGSAIRQLIRVLAYNSMMQAYKDNFLFNEMGFGSADIRANVTQFASSILNYTPTGYTSSRMFVDLKVTPAPGQDHSQTLLLSREVLFYGRNDVDKTYLFSPISEYVGQFDTTLGAFVFKNVELAQGSWGTYSWVVESVAGIEEYEIPSDRIDINTLKVVVFDSPTSSTFTPWNRYNSAYDLERDAKIYFLKVNRAGNYVIETGDGIVSAKPTYGQVVVASYLNTDGPVANGVTSLAPGSSVGGFYDITVEVVNSAASSGGADPEPIDRIKRLAPLVWGGQGKAVTDADYVGLVPQIYPNAGDVTAWGGELNDPPKFGYEFIAIKPANGEYLTTAEKRRVEADIAKHCVGQITPVVVDPLYTYIDIDVIAKYNPRLTIMTKEAIESKVEDKCRQYSKTRLESFGAEFEYSRMSEYINSIDASIHGNRLSTVYKKVFYPELNVDGAYTFNFYRSVLKGSVRVDDFRVSDADGVGATYTMEDDSNGNLHVYKYRDGNRVLFIQRSGVVDYVSGNVKLSRFRPNGILGDGVKLTARADTIDQSIKAVRDSVIKIGDIRVVAEVSNG